MSQPFPDYSNSRLVSAALWISPVAVFLLMYHDMLGAWWMADDSMLLLSVAQHGTAAHFIRPVLELGLVPSNLTPWLYASYGIDFAVGGLNPKFAYFHHLFSWCATLTLLTALLRRGLGLAIASMTVIWFELAVPTSALVLFLCTRHYVEGLLASCLCVAAYTAYRRRHKPRYLAISAICCAWAMMAKEVFVPLAPLLILHYALYLPTEVSPSGFRAVAEKWILRLRLAFTALWPIAVLPVGYVLYRGYMLGFARLFSGYDEPKWRTQPSMLRDVPGIWEWACGWKRWQSVLWIAFIALGMGLWYARNSATRRWRTGTLGIAVVICVIAPIYPVLGLLVRWRVNPHYLMIPVGVFFALAGWAFRECYTAIGSEGAQRSSRFSPLAQRRLKFALVAIAVILTVGQLTSARRNSWPWNYSQEIERYRAEGEYELYSSDRTLIVHAEGLPWHHVGLQRLRQLALHLPPGPTACVGDACGAAMVWQQEHQGSCVRYLNRAAGLQRVSCVTGVATEIR